MFILQRLVSFVLVGEEKCNLREAVAAAVVLEIGQWQEQGRGKTARETCNHLVPDGILLNSDLLLCEAHLSNRMTGHFAF